MKTKIFKAITATMLTLFVANVEANAQDLQLTTTYRIDVPNKFTLDYSPHNNVVNSTFQLPYNNTSSAWLVVSDGPHPMHNAHVQLVMDFEKNVITAQTYKPGSMQNAYKTSQHLGTFKDAIIFADANKREASFTIDATAVNAKARALGAKELKIGEKAGIWGITTNGADIQYDNEGKIIGYAGRNTAKITDFANRDTEVIHHFNPPVSVSEPMGMLIMASAFGLFFGVRKKRK
ncbi:MAG: hypothetical protein ACJARD_000462 [Alphaproteobacteria bacterium]|jgi:hypothetical protein